MDDELEHSPRSWLDDFMQQFSWCRPSAQASLFLNNYFLPGVIVDVIIGAFLPNDASLLFSQQTLLNSYILRT